MVHWHITTLVTCISVGVTTHIHTGITALGALTGVVIIMDTGMAITMATMMVTMMAIITETGIHGAGLTNTITTATMAQTTIMDTVEAEAPILP